MYFSQLHPVALRHGGLRRGDINLLFIPFRRAGGPGGNYVHNVFKTMETAVDRCSSPVICTILSSDYFSFHYRY